MYFKVLHFFQSMSGDSSNHQQSNKKLEEESSLVIERPKGPIATAASGGVLVSADGPQEKDADIANPEEKQEKSEFIKRNKEEDNVSSFFCNEYSNMYKFVMIIFLFFPGWSWRLQRSK